MNAPANIYSAVVFDLHPKVKEFLDSLNDLGQIDLDANGYPYLLAVEKTGSNVEIRLVRNGQQESAIMNTRKRADPILSFSHDDGFKRKGGKRVISVDAEEDKNAPRPERARRPSMESFRQLTDDILRG